MAASSKTLSKEQIANLSKREKTTILIAIVSLYFVVCSTMTISPALQTLYNAFPDFDRTTVMYIYTLPSLVGIPVTILIGLIAGTKVRYRTILLSATALMVVMGTAPSSSITCMSSLRAASCSASARPPASVSR